jgi:two-component system sensor histidine kinase KdpD
LPRSIDAGESPRSGFSAFVWPVLAAVGTAVLWTQRERLDQAHMALFYLLLVLFASAREGRRTGLVMALLCFLAFNFFLLPPYYTFSLEKPIDWWILVAFLVTSAVAAELLSRARRQREITERWAAELDRLSALGAETLNAPRAEDAVQAIARVIRDELEVASCELFLLDHAAGRLERLGHAGYDGGEMERGGARELLDLLLSGHPTGVSSGRGSQSAAVADTLPLLAERDHGFVMPLFVRGRGTGALRLSDPNGIALEGRKATLVGALSHYAALALDRVRLTAEAEHVEALREADRLKDVLLATLSHDLRTPLTTIKALAAEIRAGGDERAAVVEEEADRLNRLVGDLLDLSRFRAGAIPLQPELIAVDDLLGAALQRLSGHAQASRIHTRLNGDSLLVGRFDFVHSLRVLVNLIENALKYSPPDTNVEVTVQDVDGQLMIQVSDQGTGIDVREAERIFEPFVRSAKADDSGNGAGLGLAIARGLARAQDGDVLYAPRPGGGSVFTLRLPAADLSAEIFTKS